MTFRHDDSSDGATTINHPEVKLSPQVLVVDDSQEIRELITLMLRRWGFRVLKAENGLAAQCILATEHPTLVISDLEMPICDGWDLLSYCHAQHPDLPVLIASGAPLGRHPEIESWASGLLPKPFGPDEFRFAVRSLVSLAA